MFKIEDYNFNYGCFIINDESNNTIKKILDVISDKSFIIFEGVNNNFDSSQLRTFQYNSASHLKAALRTDPDVIVLNGVDVVDYDSLYYITNSGVALFLFNCNFDMETLREGIDEYYIFDLNKLIIKNSIENF